MQCTKCGAHIIVEILCQPLSFVFLCVYDILGKLNFVSVSQELPRTEATVLEYVRSGDTRLMAIEAELEKARAADDGMKEAELLGDYDSAGGWTSAARAAELSDGLGFEPADIERPVKVLSGGLQMRANMARALMSRADVLMLDEPTNHLDLDAVLWLEKWLQRFAGTLLRLLVTGFLVLAASNNCRMPFSNSPTAFSKAPSCPTRTIATDGCRSNDGGRNIFTVSTE